MRYRSDIDGLRAIAVLLVLMFHGGLTIFPSGFIGVDIFFVISGFLITSIIHNKLINNNFSLPDFYISRLWRLQPALILILILTLIVAAIFYLPADFINYLKSAQYTTSFISNQYFERITTSYASPDSAFFLLLHTWSLSIEWQWYLILPAIIYFLHRFISQKNISIATISIAIVFIGIAFYFSNKNPDKSYYFLSSRIFEFMIGSSLATLNLSKISFKRNASLILGVLSLVALIYCATKNNIVIGYPDYHALIVSLATALLILIGASKNTISSSILSWPPLVFIGTISYSLYLWHWPIFSTARYLGFTENLYFLLVCYSLTFITAYLSYILIEKPYRRKRCSLIKSLVILVLIPVVAFTLLSLIAKSYDGLPIRFGSELSHIESSLKKYNSTQRELCFNSKSNDLREKCNIGDHTTPLKKALLIGDSNSSHFWSFFDVLGSQSNTSITAISSSSCLALPDIKQYKWGVGTKINDACLKNTKKYFNYIKTEKYDFVIIGELWSNYLNNIAKENGKPANESEAESAIYHALDNAITLIEKSGATPILIKEIAHMPKDYMDCFYSPYKERKNFKNNKYRCGFKITPSDTTWVERVFNKIENDHPKVIFINPRLIQCKDDHCLGNIDGKPIYRDSGHLTDYASYNFGLDFIKAYKNPLD